MARKGTSRKRSNSAAVPPALAGRGQGRATAPVARPSALLDTRIIYCGDCLDHLRKLPAGGVDRLYVWHRFSTGECNSNRNYEVFRGDLSEPRPSGSGPRGDGDDRHASTAAHIDHMWPRCVELARVLKKTGSFYYHCDDHASHCVKVMLDLPFGHGRMTRLP